MGNKTKNSLASIGVSLAPVAATFLVEGQLVEGVFLSLLCGGLIFGYTYLDDKSKSDLTLPDGVDEDTFIDIAERLGELENKHSVSERLNEILDGSKTNGE